MRHGIVLPFFDAADVADAAVQAERAGWDGVFLAEVVWGVDAWVALAAAAVRTTTIRLGTMLTPLPRVRPWDLASRVGTVDRLSGGRAQLAVGLGAMHPGWTAFEAEIPRRERAQLLDEGLAVYDGLMRGQPFSFSGEKYTVTECDFFNPPPPVQRPRVPVWVVGGHPSAKSLGRAVRWDGLVPNILDGRDLTPPVLAEIVAAAKELRAAAGLPWDGYDVVAEGITEPGAPVAEWADAGATWWLESDWSKTPPDGSAAVRQRIEAGP